MKKKILNILEEVNQFEAKDTNSVEFFRLKFLSKKGLINQLFATFKTLSHDKKREIGALLNELKQCSESKWKVLKNNLASTHNVKKDYIDLTLPSIPDTIGALHPLSIIRHRIIKIFECLGFSTVEGPEIEDDWHNFSALNFPKNHPAREMQDTFFLEDNPTKLLRTHTSNVQIRLMNQKKPPLRSIMPGRVYRNETVSARAHMFFHQIEGLYIDKNTSFIDLKQTLYHFAKEMYGNNIDIRFRPSFFPFTEPSAEIDISCLLCNKKGCAVCKYSGWVEIAGSGMVHPTVLENCHINPAEYTGFAFGMGIERVAQLHYRINDIRLYSENDLQFLRQFKAIF